MVINKTISSYCLLKNFLRPRSISFKCRSMASFKLIASCKVNDTTPVSKYQSDTTGLTVVLAEVEGPVVNGYFTLATEAHDDDGLPHTLEHLIFLGSEKYPYKGVLDLLANRCLASGTNAWTDTDHTCYTMTTAGKDGFLALLPIYLDHILYPTLTDSGFITEVHHISGEGEDGGVVYCEMQGRENSGESRAHLAMMRAAYAGTGYASETGGIMKNLRESTSNAKVRAYHAKFYRPENLTLIICGQVKIEEVFAVLGDVEKKIILKGKRPPFDRPWQTPVKKIEKVTDIQVVYPSDEEDCGLVYVAWHGPLSTRENLKLTACSILLRYLSDTSVSPLQRDFIETANPYASRISYDITENSLSLLYFAFENVPIEKVDVVYNKLQGVLKKIGSGEEKIDMQRMKTIIERNILEYVTNLENNPHDTIAFIMIGDLLYGDNAFDFEMRLNVKKQLDFLSTQPESYWLKLLNEFLIQAEHIIVRAKPSIAEKEKMSKDESDRIEQQRKVLGEAGLALKDKELSDAMEKNEIQPPSEMLTHVPVPSVDGIYFHPVEIYNCKCGNTPRGFDLTKLPVYSEAYDIHTNFVYLIVTLDTEPIPIALRPYLLMFFDLLLKSPINRDGTLIPYEEVVKALESDTITIGTRLGLETSSKFSCGPFCHTASLMLQVEPKKYELGIQWIYELLHKTEFTSERIRVCAAQIANTVSEAKRKGNSIVRDLLKSIYYPNDCNVKISSMLKQQKFLNSLLEKIDKVELADAIIDDLNSIRKILVDPKNIGLHIAADFNKLAESKDELIKPWNKIVELELCPAEKRLKIVPDWKVINPLGLDKSLRGTIVGIGCVESAFLSHACPCLTSFSDPDLAPILLFLQYLTQLEGPLWRQIRGQGFAYGYNILPRPNEGLLYFTLYRATNVYSAFKETMSIVQAQLTNDVVWDPILLESAKSSLMFEIIEREKNIGDLVVQSLLAGFKEVPCSYNRDLVKKINEVTVDDLNRVGAKYLTKLFSAEAKTAIVCHPDKTSDISESFKQLGIDLLVETSLEDSILSI